jgi:hypothetical protein
VLQDQVGSWDQERRLVAAAAPTIELI